MVTLPVPLTPCFSTRLPPVAVTWPVLATEAPPVLLTAPKPISVPELVRLESVNVPPPKPSVPALLIAFAGVCGVITIRKYI